MGLPTSIPSGGDGLDRFSAALPDAELPQTPSRRVAPTVPTTDSTQAEFEEFQRWKQQRDSKVSPLPSKAASDANRISLPRTQTRRSGANLQDSHGSSGYAESALVEDVDSGEWTVDPKTGKRYKALASTPKEALAAYKKTRGAGLSLSEIKALVAVEEDFDIDDLNGTAETFMAHLRVPPSQEEREEILRKKAELVQKQKAERAALDEELNDKEGTLEDPESDPFNETPTKKRGLFGRKS